MNTDELESSLRHFTGTTQYARLFANVLLTDGAVYLADNAQAWWLMDVYASYLLDIDGDRELFTCLKLNVFENSAVVVIEDGNDHLIAKQVIDYTDFPLASIRLYGTYRPGAVRGVSIPKPQGGVGKAWAQCTGVVDCPSQGSNHRL